MKKLAFIAFIVALVAGVLLANLSGLGRVGGLSVFDLSCNFRQVSGSGNIITQTRDLDDFSSIDVSGVFRVEATAQKDFGVEVQADDNLEQYIKTEVRGGVLHIEAEKRLKSSGPILVRVFAPNFENVEASGATNVSVKDLRSDRLGLDTSGASKISVQGSASEFNIKVSGASNVDAGELTAANAKVNASGASKVTINVSNHLDADASGASRIFYFGSPNVSQKTSGASSVTQK
jgi:hypothetical protein